MTPVSAGGSAPKTARALRRPLRRLVLAVLIGGSALSCGASIRSVYEGDVRFEHCMALDARPDVKPAQRRACWDEWASFYTFGQTRDRIDYARGREQQLTGDVDDADASGPKVAALTAPPATAPDPTSAIAPPPMMLAAADAGAPDAGIHAEETDERTAAHARCLGDCQQGAGTCRLGCKGPACERACSARLLRCSARCEQRRQGSR